MSIPTTQKQWQLPSPGVGLAGIKLVADAPVPSPADDELLVRVHATSVNYRDLFLAQCDLLPCTPNVVFLSDAAGEVVAVGKNVTRYSVGDRVSPGIMPGFTSGLDGMTAPGLPPCRGGDAPGTLTEYQTFKELDVVRIPDFMTYEQAATLPCAGVTAWNALYGNGKGLRPGMVVVVQGTGGVSLIAAQIAKAAGCRVIATSSSDKKLERIVSLGLASSGDVINYKTTPDWGAHVKSVLTGGVGADLVVDVVGALGWNQNIAAARRGGEIAMVGQLDNDSNKVGVTNTLGAVVNLNTLRGVICGPVDDYKQLMAAFALSKTVPIVDKVFAFEDAIEALQTAKRGDFFGKVVIKVTA